MEKTAKECGKCGGTGEICYSSTSYGPCPECVERNQQSAALHESVSTTEEIITFEHPQTGKDIQIVFPEMKPEPERGTAQREKLLQQIATVVTRAQSMKINDANYNPYAAAEEVLALLLPSPLPVREQTPAADELLAEVMHLWIDGYISKNPNSCADARISNETFAKISAHLDNVGIEVDYCGWSRKAGEKEE